MAFYSYSELLPTVDSEKKDKKCCVASENRAPQSKYAFIGRVAKNATVESHKRASLLEYIGLDLHGTRTPATERSAMLQGEE